MQTTFKVHLPGLLERLKGIDGEHMRNALNRLNERSEGDTSGAGALLLDTRLLHLSTTGRQLFADLLYGNYKPVLSLFLIIASPISSKKSIYLQFPLFLISISLPAPILFSGLVAASLL